MPNRDEAVRVLREQTLGINFNFIAPSGIHVRVNYSTFLRVADAIQHGQIMFICDEPIPEEANGKYVPENLYEASTDYKFYSGFMYVRATNDIWARGGVVHESVHASFDLTKNPTLMAWENEAAAYIAEDLFYKNHNFFPPIHNTREGTLSGVSRAIAFSVCGDGTIQTEQIEHLIRAVSKVKPYSTQGNAPYLSDC